MTWLEPDGTADVRYRALEALPEDATAVDALLAALKDDSWRVRRLAGEQLVKLGPVAGVVDRLVALLAERGEPGVRNAAGTVLSQLGAPALPAVSRLLAHPDPDQRKFAADILGELARPESVPQLVACLKDADSNVRVAAAEALGHIGGPAALDALGKLLDAPDAVLRVCALEGLAQNGRPPALPRLTPLLADPFTRASAYRALGLVEHPTAFSLVSRALLAPATRELALEALGARGRPVPADVEPDLRAALRASKDSVSWLARALDADGVERRLGALVASHALAEPALALPVARAVRPGAVAELGLRVLVRLGVRGARLLVSSPGTLADLPGPSRAVVAEALVKLAEPSLVTPLMAVLRAGDAELAELAARALGKSRARAAIAPLLTCFEDDALAPHAARALVMLAESWPAEVREALAPLARGRLHPHVVRAWAQVVGDEALDVVQRALNDESDRVRAAAADSVSVVPSHAAALCRTALLDESTRVRRAAAGALARLPPAEGAPLVFRALEDEDGAVLAHAARAAAALHCLDARPRLCVLTTHPDAHVALAALDALSLLGGLDDQVLVSAADHADPEVLKQVLALGADRLTVVALARDALNHPQWDVRVAAGRLLAVAGSPTDVLALHDAAAREPDPVAREALDALGHGTA